MTTITRACLQGRVGLDGGQVYVKTDGKGAEIDDNLVTAEFNARRAINV